MASAIQNLAKKFKDRRSQVIGLVEKTFSLRNELGYLSENKLIDVLGPNVKASSLSWALEEEMHEFVRKIETYQNDMLTVLTEMTTAIDQVNPAVLSINIQWLQTLIFNMQQQLTLEMALAEKILTVADQDSLVTVIACFKYPAYLTISQLDDLIERK